ncbi:hypothetical protein GCM10022243_34020 [Saccharothrix violaceirubra]|uniref:SCP1.201-like deaminase n=1 Tax=Saccharothrix violaceirubra TaxID=413306 RepID=A0A7W7WWL0_9PSEU|nr:DddA-like double-stranded DNA deaminase toxin [Saccharothrix violaceirubra]MBB4966455.1 hypothetical protein [Saccharothrix violaceirubra]
MASTRDVGDKLRQVVDKADEILAALLVAGDLAGEAATTIEIAGAGSGEADVVIASATFREVEHDASRTLTHAVDDAVRAVNRIIDTLGTTAPALPGPGEGTSVSSARPSEEQRVEALRGELPPSVERLTGAKTHGRWFKRRGTFYVTTHVEMKVAARMRTKGIRHATLIANNTPCDNIWGCENLVGIVLPAGSSLTVFGPNGYERTFTGGKKPPW